MGFPLKNYSSACCDYSKEQEELDVIEFRLDQIKSQILDLKNQIAQNQTYANKIEELKSELEQTDLNHKDARYYNETLRLTIEYLTEARENLARNYLGMMQKSYNYYASHFSPKTTFIWTPT